MIEEVLKFKYLYEWRYREARSVDKKEVSTRARSLAKSDHGRRLSPSTAGDWLFTIYVALSFFGQGGAKRRKMRFSFAILNYKNRILKSIYGKIKSANRR